MDPDRVKILSNNDLGKLTYAISNLPPAFRTGGKYTLEENYGFMPEEDLEARMDEVNGVEIFPKKHPKHRCTSICLPDGISWISVWEGDIVSFLYKDNKYTLSMRNGI